jgi:Ca2+-binding EF-hand superfamily protein
VRKFLDLGMKMSVRFFEEAKEYYYKIFKVFDNDQDGCIDFNEFRKIIKKVDPSRPDWKIHAIF